MSLQSLHLSFQEGRYLDCLRQSLALEAEVGPSKDLAYVRAYALLRLNRIEEATEAFKQCVSLGGQSPDIHRNILAGDLSLKQCLDDALERAWSLYRDDPANDVNLSNLLLALLLNDKQSEFDSLLKTIDRQLSPQQRAYGLLISSKFRANRGDYAGEYSLLEESLRLSPDDPQTIEAMAIHQRDVRNDYKAAERLFMSLAKQGHQEACAELSHGRLRTCDWSDYESDLQTIEKGSNGGPVVCNPIVVLAHTTQPKLQGHYAQAFCDVTYGRSRAVPHLRSNFPTTRSTGGIAFVSSDFRDHPIGYLVEEFFGQVNKRVDVSALYSSSRPLDGQSERLRQNVCCFHSIDGWSNEKKLGYLREANVRLLIDLNGLTKGLDLSFIKAVRASGVCPVFSWLGYPGPMPIDMFDRIILDRDLKTGVPESDQSRYIFLDSCYQPNNFVRYKKFRIKKDPSIENQLHLVVTSNAFKITPAIFDSWCRLLNRLPHARLSILCDSQHIQGNLTRELSKVGLEGRVNFWGRVDHDAHLKRLAEADLVLDTFPYSNHTGTSDALSVGTPLVTIMGDTVASRVCGSILKRLGLSTLVAEDLCGYENLTYRFATDLSFRTEIHGILQQDLSQHELFDMNVLAKEFLHKTLSSDCR